MIQSRYDAEHLYKSSREYPLKYSKVSKLESDKQVPSGCWVWNIIAEYTLAWLRMISLRNDKWSCIANRSELKQKFNQRLPVSNNWTETIADNQMGLDRPIGYRYKLGKAP